MSKFLNIKLAKTLLIGGGLIIVLGFALGFFALFQAYGKINCVNASTCGADNQLQLVRVAKGIGILGLLSSLVGGVEFIVLDRRK